MDTIGNRIKYLRTSKGISMAELENAIGASSGSVNQWEKNRSIPGGKAIISLSDFFGVSTDWLLKGNEVKTSTIFFKDNWESTTRNLTTNHSGLEPRFKSSRHVERYLEDIVDLPDEDITLLQSISKWLKQKNRSDVIQEQVSSYKSFPSTSIQIPILGMAAAGQPAEAIRFLEGYLTIPENKGYQNCFAIRVKGDSMVNAGILDGGYVIVRQQPMVENNEIALVMIDSEVTIKRFKFVEDTAVLISENDGFKPMIYRRTADMAILGKIVGYIPPEEVVIKEVTDN